jgi:2'-5' RNA ligase
MRLFTGIAPAPNVIERLSRVLGQLRPTARINWSPIENLHITSKFIGEWTDDRLEILTAALGTVAVAGPVTIAVSGFGFFPDSRRPHSFFSGVQSGPGLAELATAIDDALQPIGCPRENRPYRPHITLARTRPGGNLADLRQHIAGMTDFDFGTFDAADFHLYRSTPAGGRSAYTILATYDLIREKRTVS